MRSKILTLICLLTFLSCGINAQTKEEKKILKGLKKQYKLDDAMFINERDGFRYVKLWTKDLKNAVADTTGNLLVPSKIHDTEHVISIAYHSEQEKGMVSRRKGAVTNTFYSPGSSACFMEKRQLQGKEFCCLFYDLQGNVIAQQNELVYCSDDFNIDAYLVTNANGRRGLMSKDGRMLIPMLYDEIITNRNGICILGQNTNDMMRYGATCISDLTSGTVPCNFHKVHYSDAQNRWMVQFSALDTLACYDTTAVYNFEDEGQILFEQGNYEEARKFYVLKGDALPKAKLYIGATYYHDAMRNYNNAVHSLEIIEASNDENDEKLISGISFSFDLFSDESEKAILTLHEYENQHNVTGGTSANMLYEIEKLKSLIHVEYNRLETAVPLYQQRCISRREAIRYEREQQVKRDIEQQRLNNERIRQENERRRLENDRNRQRMEQQRRLDEQRRIREKNEQEKKRREEQNKNNGQKSGTQQTTNRSAGISNGINRNGGRTNNPATNRNGGRSGNSTVTNRRQNQQPVNPVEEAKRKAEERKRILEPQKKE